MKKKFILIFIILPAIIVAGIIYYFLIYNKNSGQTLQLNSKKTMQKIALYESKTIPKFSFNYPLFENWEISVGESTNGEMWVKYTPGESINIDFETAPGINFRFLLTEPESSLWQKATLNPKGTKYVETENKKNIAGFSNIFQIKNKFLEIFYSRDIKYENFDGNLVWKTVTDSVKAD